MNIHQGGCEVKQVKQTPVEIFKCKFCVKTLSSKRNLEEHHDKVHFIKQKSEIMSRLLSF
jgi:hypothetical protein